MAIWGLLSAGVVALSLTWPPAAGFMPSPWLGLLLWGALTSITLTRLDWADHAHSAGGVERHRIDRGAEVALAEIDARLERDVRALDIYARTLGIGEVEP
jgi:hypothetical protein